MEGMMVCARFRGNPSNVTPPATPSTRRQSIDSIHVALACADRQLPPPRHRHSSACGVTDPPSTSASIWHLITPPSGLRKSVLGLPRGIQRTWSCGDEGSWNAAWDVRPARWLHGSDSAWLLFGVCSCSSPSDGCCGGTGPALNDMDAPDAIPTAAEEEKSASAEEKYKVTGVLADGRCLFRAIVCGAWLSSGREAPVGDRQSELADCLRAQVAEELLKRRKEIEWSIEGDFDMYVKNIRQPWTWGGETELLMCSHVLQTPIWVFMASGNSRCLVNIMNYGQEYVKVNCDIIKVLFHGYGHYDALEMS